LKGREVQGAVNPGDAYRQVCDGLIKNLEELTDPATGERVVERVFRREDLYWGPHVDLAPDLILHLADYSYSFDWRVPHVGRGGGPPIFDALTGGHAANSGYHRISGVLMMAGPEINRGVQLEAARIYDVVPTALYLMDLPIPGDMDGEVLTAAIQEDRLSRRPIEIDHHGQWSGPGEGIDDAFTEEEAEAVSERLRDLGYM
jgi:predicted AlkP superfamily phosphohydrolase/phosphomutase